MSCKSAALALPEAVVVVVAVVVVLVVALAAPVVVVVALLEEVVVVVAAAVVVVAVAEVVLDCPQPSIIAAKEIIKTKPSKIITFFISFPPENLGFK